MLIESGGLINNIPRKLTTAIGAILIVALTLILSVSPLDKVIVSLIK